MEWLWKKPWLVLMVVIVLVHVFGSSSGCFPEEKRSLLRIKAAYSNDSLLPSWVDDPRRNCCDWERVTCDSFSGRVIRLSLETVNRNHGPSSPFFGCIGRGHTRLDWSFFLSFKHLRNLDLSDNCFDDFSWKGDNRSKSTLKRLETLDLSHNNFKESVMEFLCGLTSLKNLILHDNNIGGLFPSKELSLLRNLKMLSLSFNHLSGGFTTQALANLSKLEILELGALYLNGSFPIQGLCNMKQLEVLDLGGNNFKGTLDTCLGNLTSFRSLDLSGNSLSGSISAPLIASLVSLEHLSLDGNNFEGLFSLSILANYSKLKVLELGEMNSETFQVQTENAPWNASFQLEQLDISSCKVNLPTKTIPTFLLSQNGLRYIDLSGNNIVGMFPDWLLVNNPRLEEVDLGGNSFTGPFKLPFDLNHHMDQLQYLDISNNEIQGELPNNIGFIFPHLDYLDVSNNKFDGHIPLSIGEMSSLKTLKLGSNNFSGNVHEHILNGCISLSTLNMDNNQLNGTLLSCIGKHGLYYLTASRNNFEGPITKELCQYNLFILDLSFNKFFGTLPSCLNIPFINLRGNNLTGTIPEASVNNSWVLMDLSDNKFTGTIPESIYGLQSLIFLLLANNQLRGQLSSHICKLTNLQILDLSHNNFSGYIPSCFNNIRFSKESIDLPNGIFGVSWRESVVTYDFMIVTLMIVYGMEEVQLITKGSSFPYQGHALEIMSALDLSSNQLIGEIPHQLGNLSGLQALNLSHNHLNGPIPGSFHKLESIESLDLSNNNLSGQIPFQLQDLHYLSVFNVCYNNLSGRAPDQGQFGTFDESSYKGNPYLTWSNSNKRITAPPPPSPPLDEGKKDETAIDFTSFYWSFAASYVTMLLALVTILWINPYWRRVWFYFMESCLLKCFGRFLEDAFY